MFKRWLAVLALLVLIISCSDKSTSYDNRSLREKLEAIPGATVVQKQDMSGMAVYQIDLLQPVDHNNPNGPQFSQRFYLTHRSETAPMVLALSGYDCTGNYIYGESGILQANQIYVGHRLMVGAKIDPVDYSVMNMEQASADYHHIVEVLKPIYTGKWMSFGASKGGMTALFHKRFYPSDVDAVLTRVAPLPTQPEDPRFNAFFTEKIATPECRARMEQFQREALLHKEELIPMINSFINSSSDTYPLDAETMLEYAVLEYPFSFWQYGSGNCEQIPGSGSSVSAIYYALNSVVGFDYYSQEEMDKYYPAYYHMLTECGYYGFVTDHISDLLTTDDHYSNDIFAPSGVDLTFNAGVMPSVISWLQNQGDHIIYIYGANDPWGAAAIELNGSASALKIVQPGENHNVQLSDLDDIQEVYDSLESWLDVPVYPQAAPVMMKTAPEDQPHRPGLF